MSALWRSTRGAGLCWKSIGRWCRSMTTSRPTQLPLFEDMLTSSAAARLVSRRALRAKGAVQMMNDGSGRIFSEWFLNATRAGSWQRILLVSFLCNLAGLTGFCRSWKKRATKQKRWFWGLTTSAHRTLGDASGLWPTPSATTYGSNRGGAAGRVGKIRHSLGSLFAIPQARDCKDARASVKTSTKNSRPLNEQACAFQRGATNHSVRGNLHELNPDWVETLQGFPVSWTALPEKTVSRLWETRLSRSVPK